MPENTSVFRHLGAFCLCRSWLGCTLKGGRTATQRSKKGSEKVLERVLGKCSQKGSEKLKLSGSRIKTVGGKAVTAKPGDTNGGRCSIATANMRRLREVKRKKARDKDKWEINSLRQQIHYLEAQVQEWWAWYRADEQVGRLEQQQQQQQHWQEAEGQTSRPIDYSRWDHLPEYAESEEEEEEEEDEDIDDETEFGYEEAEAWLLQEEAEVSETDYCYDEYVEEEERSHHGEAETGTATAKREVATGTATVTSEAETRTATAMSEVETGIATVASEADAGTAAATTEVGTGSAESHRKRESALPFADEEGRLPDAAKEFHRKRESALPFADKEDKEDDLHDTANEIYRKRESALPFADEEDTATEIHRKRESALPFADEEDDSLERFTDDAQRNQRIIMARLVRSQEVAWARFMEAEQKLTALDRRVSLRSQSEKVDQQHQQYIAMTEAMSEQQFTKEGCKALAALIDEQQNDLKMQVDLLLEDLQG